MELSDISHDVLRQILIYYIDNSKINQIKIKFIGSKVLNEVNNNIQLNKPPLYEACLIGSSGSAMNHIDECDFVSENGYTPLMVACKHRMSELTLKILDDGNNCKGTALAVTGLTRECEQDTVAGKVEQISKDGFTALIHACQNGMNATALKLLDTDCKPEQVNVHGDTASGWAFKYDMIDVIDKMQKKHINLIRYVPPDETS
jgi:ankyrin repeat protein